MNNDNDENDVGDISDRVGRLEAALQELNGKLRATRDAEAAWQLTLRARDQAVFGNQAGEIAVLPSDLVDVLAAGRAADVRVSKTDEGQITFEDDRGLSFVVPISFFINMPRLLRSWESRRKPVSVPVPCTGETDETKEVNGD